MSNNQKDSQAVGILGLTSITVAFTVTLNNFSVSAGIMGNMSFGRGLVAIILAWICLSIVYILSGTIGAVTHKNAAEIFTYTFGRQGFRIPSICMSLAMLGFGIFDFWYCGAAISALISPLPEFGFYLGLAVIVAASIFGIIKDISSLKWLTSVTIPIAFILFIVILIVTIYQVGWDTVTSYTPDVELPMVTGVNILFSSFIACASGFSDITCHATSKKAVFVAMPLAMFAVALQFFVAQVGYYGYVITDFVSLVVALGGGIYIVGNIFTIFAQCNTAPSNVLIISTQLNKSIRIPKKALIVIVPLILAVGSIALHLGADITIITQFASFLSCMFGPLLGILAAECHVVRRLDLSEDVESLAAFCPSGIISLGLGFAVGIYLTYFAPFSSPVALVLYVGCFILQIILRKACKLR